MTLKYHYQMMNGIKDDIHAVHLVELARKHPKDFTRNRKLEVKDLLLYLLKRKGWSTKMELDEFMEICEKEEVSSAALLKQREKLNPEVFKYLNDKSIKTFYHQFSSEVKTFKGHVILAIDGSDWEVPNNRQARAYTQVPSHQAPRVKVSHLYDVLNCYVLDSLVEPYKFNELKMANRHLEKARDLVGDHAYIKTMDRGYHSLADLYHSIRKNEKFVIRMKTSSFKKEQQKMTSDDEWVEIEYQYDRIRRYKDTDEEFYSFYEAGHTLKVRLVKVLLPTGEVEILMTNLDKSEFSKEEIEKIYQLRWGIESHYHDLKESFKGTAISSGQEDLIKQDIYSQCLVFNMLQAVQNEAEKEINQKEYKHKMKININMAVGYIKKYMIDLMLEDDHEKRGALFDTLDSKILKNIVPIRPGRSYERKSKGSSKNKHPISKRRAY